jgi:hypothetical protein
MVRLLHACDTARLSVQYSTVQHSTVHFLSTSQSLHRCCWVHGPYWARHDLLLFQPSWLWLVLKPVGMTYITGALGRHVWWLCPGVSIMAELPSACLS